MSPHRRGGLARNPLETLVPDPRTAPAPGPDLQATTADPAPGPSVEAPRKVKFGGYIDPEIADQVRDTLVALGPEWTVGEFMEQAFLAFMHTKENELNDGRPFPHRRRDKLRTGRRVG